MDLGLDEVGLAELRVDTQGLVQFGKGLVILLADGVDAGNLEVHVGVDHRRGILVTDLQAGIEILHRLVVVLTADVGQGQGIVGVQRLGVIRDLVGGEGGRRQQRQHQRKQDR